MTITHASLLSNAQLTTEVSRLARCEREATVALIVHLAEFDARRLYEPAGYSSLFKYCMAVLRLSEDAVYNRIEAARAARRYPLIIDMLGSGALSLTTVRLLVRHLTRENHAELLAAASGKGKQAVEELLAHRFPQADVAARVRKLPSLPETLGAAAVPGAPTPNVCPPDDAGCETPAAVVSGPGLSVIAGAAPAAPRPIVRPLAPDRYEIRFTATAAMREKLREAQDLLGHAIPTGDMAQVFERALTLLVADLKRKKCAATPRPRPTRGQSEDSSNIPAEVRRAVWARDKGCCAFLALDGHRCGERRFLEYHHVIPRGVRGPATVENIQLRCRAHNGHEVDRFYGPGKRRTRADVGREGKAIYGTRDAAASRPGTSRHAASGARPTGIRTIVR
jgi:5-methylcytosine-specific restriction endonuclease McrA